jgi:hypothetical protein
MNANRRSTGLKTAVNVARFRAPDGTAYDKRDPKLRLDSFLRPKFRSRYIERNYRDEARESTRAV